jgi:hypothetical protein
MKKGGNKLYRCIYVYEFSDNCAYIGLSYNLNKRSEIRKTQQNDAVTRHINKTNLVPKIKQLSEYVYVDIAAELENDCIETYKILGWNVLNKHRGGNIGASEIIWTKELCHVEALKFKSRSEFYYRSNKIYTAAQRQGWLNDICKHMNNKIHHWTIDEVKAEAFKYKSRYEFQLNNKAAYTWAIRNNCLNEICTHMQSMIGSNQYGKYSRTGIS